MFTCVTCVQNVCREKNEPFFLKKSFLQIFLVKIVHRLFFVIGDTFPIDGFDSGRILPVSVSPFTYQLRQYIKSYTLSLRALLIVIEPRYIPCKYLLSTTYT
jgi:hypothetical protein